MWPLAYRTCQSKKKIKRISKGANVKFCSYYLAAVMRTIVSYMCSKRIALFSRV